LSIPTPPQDTEDNTTKPKRNSTDLALKINQAANLSLSQTIKVLQVLHQEIKDDCLLPPNRSDLHYAVEKFVNKSSLLCTSSKVLRFDGKTFLNLYGCEKIESLAICYDENLLALRQLSNKKAVTTTKATRCRK